MGCCSVRWNERVTAAGAGRPHRGFNRQPWEAWEIALMVSGFVVFWPAGLAILCWILWRRRSRAAPGLAWLERVGAGLPGTGLHGAGARGNSAFEDWKRGELDRLEQERRRLAEAEQEFAAFLDQLKRARDREEFDRFMAARKGAAGGEA